MKYQRTLIIIALGLSLFLLFGLTQNEVPEKQITEDLEVATFAGGCFWCTESYFEKHEGVIDAISGYAGGIEENPTYNQVASGATSHREAAQIYYDPEIISYNELLDIYWRHIDPTDNDGSFIDRGFQYSPAIFYNNEEEKTLAEASKQALTDLNPFNKEIIVPIIEFTTFYEAEEYHQDYSIKNPVRYNFYLLGSGRDSFIQKNWKNIPDFIESSYSKPLDAELKEILTPLQYKVTQNDATERPFNNKYWDNKEQGIYVDIVSGEPLFSSTHKYKSGTGWPSFTQPLVESNIIIIEDTKFFITRTELRSKQADSHLGHLFPDGPEPKGLRYCINSASLEFISFEDLNKSGYAEFLYLFE